MINRSLTYLLFLIIFFTPAEMQSSGGDIDEHIDEHIAAGERFEKEGDPLSALSRYALLLNNYSESMPPHEQKQLAAVFKHAGDLCNSLERCLESLDYYTMGYQAAERGGDRVMMMRCLGNIGNVYSAFEDYERAITYYSRGYEMATQSQSSLDQYKFLYNISLVYASMKSTKEALEAFRKMQLANSHDYPSAIRQYHLAYAQGVIASAGDNHIISRHYYMDALRVAKENGMDTLNIADLLINIGNSYLNAERTDSASYYFDESLRLCNSAHVSVLLPRLYDSLAAVSELDGDSIRTQRYKTLSSNAKDSIFNIGKYLGSKNRLIEYEEMMSSSKISNLNQKVAIQWVILICAAVILTIVASFTFIIVKRNKELKFANKKLVDRNQELIKSEEKSKVLSEKYLQVVSQKNNLDTQMKNNEKGSYIPPVEKQDNKTEKVISETGQTEENPYLSDDQTGVILSRINKVLDTEEHLFNPDFSLSLLAQLVKSNTKYVSWVINESYGKNFKTVLNECRIKEASKRLEDSEKYGSITIQAIGEEVGYKSATSFIQAFKKIVGVTPAVYQRLSSEKKGNLTHL